MLIQLHMLTLFKINHYQPHYQEIAPPVSYSKKEKKKSQGNCSSKVTNQQNLVNLKKNEVSG